MGINNFTREELIQRIGELERQCKTVRSTHEDASSELKQGEEELHQKIQDNSFLAALSFQLADSYYSDAINDIALPAISEHTGAVFSLFSLYNIEKKALDLSNVESSSRLINSAVDIAGKQILETSSPVSDSNYKRIINEKVKHSHSLTEVSFGAVTPRIDKAIRRVSGLQHFFAIAHVDSGKLFGTSLLAFKENQSLPSEELLQSYSNITAVALRNKLNEAALKESEANLKAITENTIESIWSVDTNYRLLYINEVFETSYYNTFGVRIKRGDNVLDVLPAKLQNIWKERYDRALKNDNFIVSDTIEGSDGLVYIEVALNPIEIDGKVVGVSLYGKDVTEKEKANQERLKVMERNKAILNAIPDLMFVFNSKHELIDFHAPDGNKEWSVDADRFLGARIQDLLPEEYCQKALRDIDQVITEANPVYNNYELRNNGLTQFYESRTVLSGKKEVLAIIRNITKDKEAERNRLENEANVKSILENSLESIWSIDLDYNIQYANEVFVSDFYDAFGIELKKGVNIYQSLPSPLNKVWKERYDKAFRNERFAFIEEIELTDSKIFIEVSINPIIIDGKVEGASLYGRDITASKIAELNLIAAKEKAEESDRLKSAFLANMSHEIRTPMNGIMGFADLLKRQDLEGEERMTYIDVIQKSGDRMLNIINDLINISKIEAGQEIVVLSETVLNDQLKFMYTFFSSQAEAKGVSLSIVSKLPDDETRIVCDKEKVYAVLTNLIKNAIKFTHKGTIKVGYEVKGNYFEFYVKDTGIGIPKNQQESVFNRFVQADTRLSSNYEGSGLGLAISKAYITMLGGEMWLVSEEDVGSTFFFTLPVKKPQAKATLESMDQKILEVDNNKAGLKILLAEDNPSSQLLIRSVLSKDNYTILIADNGEEAVEMCRENSDISVVLMDIKMPVLNGFTAAKYIKKFKPNLPIVAQTAFALESDKSEYQSVFDAYLTKPINERELRMVLNKILK